MSGADTTRDTLAELLGAVRVLRHGGSCKASALDYEQADALLAAGWLPPTTRTRIEALRIPVSKYAAGELRAHAEGREGALDDVQAVLDTPVVEAGIGKGWPQVRGRCAACGHTSLFLGVGGHVTCAWRDCSDPCAADTMLAANPPTTTPAPDREALIEQAREAGHRAARKHGETDPHDEWCIGFVDDVVLAVVDVVLTTANIPPVSRHWPSTQASRDALIEQAARTFHETYERLAPRYNYKTRPESAVPWSKVPHENKALMIETTRAVVDVVLAANPPTSEPRVVSTDDDPTAAGVIAGPPTTTPDREALVAEMTQVWQDADNEGESDPHEFIARLADAVLAAGLPGDWQARIEALRRERPEWGSHQVTGWANYNRALDDVLAALGAVE